MARGTRHDVLGALAAGAIVTLFCFVLLWHDPLVFWNDDYELSILPVFADVARSWSEGHLPLLSPYSWVCGNLAGEYQYGTFSIFINAAVVLIWKLPLTFPQQAAALSIAHLFVLAMGGYMLARGRAIAPPLAMLVAFVAALNGWIVCWGATDWFGALAAFAWLPWAWWGLERAADAARGKWRWVWPVPFVYLLVTGGFPYTVLMLALITSWICLRVFAGSFPRARRNLTGLTGQDSKSQSHSFLKHRIGKLLPLLVGAALGLGMAAPAWLALLDYMRGSAREVQQASSHLQWRVPLAAWPGLIFPNWTVSWYDFSTRFLPHTATELACGAVAPLALLSALIRSPTRFWAKLRWELALMIIVAVIAMLPSAGVFRWSFRWLPLFHVALALCAAEALQQLSNVKISPVAFGVTCGLAGLMWIIGAQGPHALPFVVIAIAIVAVWLVLERRASQGSAWIPAVLTLATLLATYLCIRPNCGVPKYNLSQQLLQPAPLDRSRLYLSVYPFPEFSYRLEAHPAPVGQDVRPGSTSMWAGLRFVTGYSPIRPAGVARLFSTGIHGQVDFAIATRVVTEQGDSNGELARLGVDGLVIAKQFALQPQPRAEWQLAYSSADADVYYREGAPLPLVRAYSNADLTLPNLPASLELIENSRNKVVVDYHGDPADELPVFIAFSRPFFPGYVASGQSRSFAVTSFRGLMPVIELPAGYTGRITLNYRPAWLVYGGMAAIVCAFVSLAGGVAAAVTGRRNRST